MSPATVCCGTCGKTKPITEFHRDKSRPSGRRSQCKSCRKGPRRTAYLRWRGMIRRCYAQTDAYYGRYGGRGIAVCDRWLNSFEDFWADVGDAPPGMSLDRINNDGNYEPSNVRWATPKEQAANRQSFGTLKTECLRGHLFDEENTRWQGTSRQCKTCNRDRHRAYRAGRRAA